MLIQQACLQYLVQYENFKDNLAYSQTSTIDVHMFNNHNEYRNVGEV